MSLYEALLIIHIVAVAVILGGVATLLAQGVTAIGSGEESAILGFTKSSDLLGTRLFAPASVLLLAAGIWAASDGNWDFADAWISVGFVAWIVMVILGGVFFPRNSRSVRAAIAEQGVGGVETRKQLRVGAAVAVVQLAVLVVAIWAMVAKPGL